MRAFSALALVTLPVLLLACPDETVAPPDQACVPGAVVACACEGGTVGTQTCDDDGSAVSACACTPCTPITCDAAGAACGVLDNGCGATLACGTCADDERCDDGTCLCAEGLVRADDACVAPAVDTCGLGLDDCARDARCDNTADGAFTCACLPGFVGDGRVCLADLCGQGLGGCGDNATCTNTDAGAQCACRAGYVGDGRRCVPGPDAIADVSGNPPVLVALTDGGQATVLVEGLSRVGWDLPVGTIVVPGGDGTTLNRKFPSGPATFPLVRLRGLRGTAVNVDTLAADLVARASDNRSLAAIFSLPQPGGGVLSVNVSGRVSAVDPTIVVDGGTSVLGGFDWQPGSIAINTFATAQPTLPTVRPGYVVEFANIAPWSIGLDDTDGLPEGGPFVTRRIQPIVATLNKAVAARIAAQNGQDLRTITGLLFQFSLISVQHTGAEVGRRNGFETWASNVSIFTPDVDIDRTGLQITWQIDLAEDAN